MGRLGFVTGGESWSAVLATRVRLAEIGALGWSKRRGRLELRKAPGEGRWSVLANRVRFAKTGAVGWLSVTIEEAWRAEHATCVRFGKNGR